MSKLHIKDLPPTQIEKLPDTPGAGDTTHYIAYSDPTRQNDTLKYCVITRIIKYATGITEIRYASNSPKEKLDFNKKWADRASYSYEILNY